MSSLTFVEKEQIANFFGFKSGYIFTFVQNKGYNKTNTRNIILEATGIDIYSNPEYTMSQEKCIRKIWDEYDDYIVGQLLKVMLDYYSTVADWNWEWKEQQDYKALRELQERLCSKSIELPSVDTKDLKMLLQDIERNFSSNTPELVIDRLHTFAVQFIRDICISHNISIVDAKGNYFSLESLVGSLKNFYRDNNYFSSEFCVIAIQTSINVFAKFNELRNNHSFSHPNPILEKLEAEYAVKTISNTLVFLEKVEKRLNKTQDTIIFEDDNELPF